MMPDDMKISTSSGEAGGHGGGSRRNDQRCYSSWWAHLTCDCRSRASVHTKVEFFRPIFKPRPKPVTFRPGPSGEVIYIPPMMASRELSKYKMTARLRSALGLNNYWLLGDLDGFAYDDLMQLRNCGKVSVAELKALVKRIQNEAKFHSSHPVTTGVGVESDILKQVERAGASESIAAAGILHNPVNSV
jgi:hypothetical protein